LLEGMDGATGFDLADLFGFADRDTETPFPNVGQPVEVFSPSLFPAFYSGRAKLCCEYGYNL